MKKPLLVMVAALALQAAPAHADGIDLSWSDCTTFGLASTSFACNSNSGAPFILVASFVPPAAVDSLVGLSAQIDITAGSSLPDWWRVSSGECRSSALSTNFDFTANSNCADPWFGQAAGGFAWDSAFLTPNRGRLRVQCAIPDNLKGPVDSAQEYYGFKATVLRTKTLGGGSCAGCDLEACIVLNSIQLFQPFQLGFDPQIIAPQTRNYVTWQSATVLNCPQSTPVRSTTWGALKSLYR